MHSRWFVLLFAVKKGRKTCTNISVVMHFKEASHELIGRMFCLSVLYTVKCVMFCFVLYNFPMSVTRTYSIPFSDSAVCRHVHQLFLSVGVKLVLPVTVWTGHECQTTHRCAPLRSV